MRTVPRHPDSSVLSGRKRPVGAEPLGDGVHFRVWAPRTGKAGIAAGNDPHDLRDRYSLINEGNGYHSLFVPGNPTGLFYGFILGDEERFYPDPASRFQPLGPHGPSQVIDPGSFPWSDGAWKGFDRRCPVLYEIHIGTFTRESTWKSAEGQLPALSSLGITALEIMPVAEFCGRFGWGYDGVDLFAPSHLYGAPDDFRRFVDRAHSLKIGVVLDVVYNHVGPDGNYLRSFSPDYFTSRYMNEWGEPINFDGDDSGPVREFFTMNAAYWIDEYHLDGLRIDATQQMFDFSQRHILAEITSSIRIAANGRTVYIVAENEPQDVKLVMPVDKGGYGMDALWNDDFHHTAMVALTGHNEAYYSDYMGTPQELVSCMKYGYLYQGQYFKWQRKRRGTPAFGIPSRTFVTFMQNHDQVANSGRGLRIHDLTTFGRYKAMTAVMLLSPGTPMLFQGQEFASSSPFCFFSDHRKEVLSRVVSGRARFLAQFPSLATREMQANLYDPSDPESFEKSKIDTSERARNEHIYTMHKDLIRIRRNDEVIGCADPRIDGAVLGPEAFLIRYFSGASGDRLLLVNLGRDLSLLPSPEPLLAPYGDSAWELYWSSEDVRYRGNGTPAVETVEGWKIPGHSAVLLKPGSRHPENGTMQ